MSETEPIPPTSSVTALRIPIIKKGEYDLWSMKMRQYIAITDHILWDIITNGNQTTTDPASPSVSAPKTSLAANARRNNEKALNILLSAIPDRHLLSFHDAVDARSLWKAIKSNIEEKEASNVRSGDTEELDLETTQSTARQGTITPRTLNFEDEAGPSSPLRPIQVMESEEQLKVAEILVAISRPRGLSIPGH
ncbi:hypothetical protein Tco_1075236 [Tanacetum coccineum]